MTIYSSHGSASYQEALSSNQNVYAQKSSFAKIKKNKKEGATDSRKIGGFLQYV